MKDFLKNPFPGLRSFEQSDSDIFFGRDNQINDLVNNLIINKFVTVLGPAGSGKSSIIKAGVIPKLLKMSESKNQNIWDFVIFTPNNNAINNFSTALSKFVNYSEDKIEKELTNNKDFLNEIINILEKNINKKYLIYVDQLEDIFFYKTKTEKQTLNSKLFIEYLLNIIKKSSNIFILSSLKTEYLDACREFDGLADAINKGHYLLPKLTYLQKKDAILLPFEKNNIVISENFVSKIISDIEKEDSELLILQHTLKRTWDYWLANSSDNQAIDLIHYEAVGTVTNALTNHAEEIYHEFESEKYQTITEKIFKALVFIKADNSISRTSVLLSDLCEITNTKEADILKVINEFRNKDVAFIVPYNDFEINSESLININKDILIEKWFRLNEWIKAEKKSVQLYLQISKSAYLNQIGETGLLINPELQNGLDWFKTQTPNSSWANRYDKYFERTINYLDFSKAEYDFQITAKEKKQKRDILIFRRFAIILGAASLISILFLIFALNLKFKAEASEKQAKINESIALENSNVADDKKKEAISNKKVAEQQQLLAEQQKIIAEQQKQLAIEKQREALLQKQIAEGAKSEAERSRDEATEAKKIAESLRDIAVEQKKKAQEQELRAKTSESKTDSLRRLAIAKSLAANSYKIQQQIENNDDANLISEDDKNLPKQMAIQAFNFNKNSGGLSSDPEIFNALSEASKNLKTISSDNNHNDAVRDVLLLNDNNTLITCGDDGNIKKWLLSNYTNSNFAPIDFKTDNNTKGGVRSLDISNNNDKLICGTYNGKILLWTELSEQAKPIVLFAHTGVVFNTFFVNEDKNILSISNDNQLIIWDLTSLPISHSLIKKFDSKPVSMAISKDKNNFAIADVAGNVYIYKLKNYELIKKITPLNNSISTIAFVDENQIAIASNSGTFELWEINSGYILTKTIYAHISAITKIDYNKKLNQLATCSYDGDIKIWNTKNFEQEPIIINKCSNWVYSLIYSKDGEKLVSASADKTNQIMFFNVNSETLYSNLLIDLNKNMSEENWLKYVGPGIEYSPNLIK